MPRQRVITSLGCLIVFGMMACDSPTEPLSTPDATAQAESTESDETRRARFIARQTLEVPPDVPKSWRNAIGSMEGRVLSLSHRHWTSQSDWRGGRQLTLKVRLFGRDSEADATVLATLKSLKLPGLKSVIQDQESTKDGVKWSMEVDRLVAPTNAKRETQLTLKWTRSPKAPAERKSCRKPKGIDAPNNFPTWLNKATAKRSTRRRVWSELRSRKMSWVGETRLLYHNGFAHDENVGQIADAARKAGLKHQKGSGPRQVWSAPGVGKLSIRPGGSDTDLGCKIRGPILEVVWHSAP